MHCARSGRNGDCFSMAFAALACSSGFFYYFVSQGVNFMNIGPYVMGESLHWDHLVVGIVGHQTFLD